MARKQRSAAQQAAWHRGVAIKRKWRSWRSAAMNSGGGIGGAALHSGVSWHKRQLARRVMA